MSFKTLNINLAYFNALSELEQLSQQCESTEPTLRSIDLVTRAQAPEGQAPTDQISFQTRHSDLNLSIDSLPSAAQQLGNAAETLSKSINIRGFAAPNGIMFVEARTFG